MSRRLLQRPALKSKDQALDEYARHAPKGYLELTACLREKSLEFRATTELRAGDICIFLGDDVEPLSAAEFLEYAAQVLRNGAAPAAAPEREPDCSTKQLVDDLLRRIGGRHAT